MPTTADYDGWDDWDDEPPPRPAPPSCCWPQCPKPASADYDLREHWAPPTCHITQSALLNRYSRSLSGEPDQLLFPPRPT